MLDERTRDVVSCGWVAPDAKPLASLDADGWVLVDAEGAYQRRDGVYWVPPIEERRDIPVGVLAKLIFAWAQPGPDEPARERMWVEIEGRDGETYWGRLENEPDADAPIQKGAVVCFRVEHVVDLCVPDGKPLSEKSKLIRCGGHGWSEPCFVCVHLTQSEGIGFNAGDGDSLRPDAWCDECDRLLVGRSGWEEVEKEPPIKVVCGACYDEFRARNRRSQR